jgi:hypothetical protein
MKITANLLKGELIANGCKISIGCKVRTLKDGTRSKAVKEVRRTIPDNLPYDPRPFPMGLWNITAVEWRKDFHYDEREYGDVKIRTDAWQPVKVWELDQDGNYFKETDKTVTDMGYLLHYSESSTTLGCIRIATKEEAKILANFIQKYLDNGEAVHMEVI